MTASRKEANKRYHLKVTYNLTLEQWNDLYVRQGGLCAICMRKLRKDRAQTDHDHACCPGATSCGKCVRGLLCKDCNYKLLGQICQENKLGKVYAKRILYRAICYLEDPSVVAASHGNELS